ncbi:MAG: hypothetical protein JWP52_1057, partial [Rhizobacter sp.]|nr:hypothetical protein [Rhizobacter sp.]
GVDLGGTKIEAVLLNSNGAQCWRERVATPRHDYGGTLQAIAALVARAQASMPEGLPPPTVGIGTPGSVTAEGRIKNANSTWLNGRPLPSDLSRLLGRQVAVANDANCLALSEATDGAGAGASVVFAAIVGTGVGAGIAVNGRVLDGPNGLAGEWGHNPLPWPDAKEIATAPTCYCGQRGCIENWLSGPALERDHLEAGGAPGSAQALDAAARQGDPLAEASLARYEHRMARALAHVINLLDPHVIVLGGGVSQISRLYERVPALWGQHVFSAGTHEPVRTTLVKSLHGDSSGVRGAAWLGRSLVMA